MFRMALLLSVVTVPDVWVETQLTVNGYGSMGYSQITSTKDGYSDPLKDCLGVFADPSTAGAIKSIAESDTGKKIAQDAYVAALQAGNTAGAEDLAKKAAEAYGLRTFAEGACSPTKKKQITEYDATTHRGSFVRDLKMGISILAHPSDQLSLQSLVGAESSPQVNGERRQTYLNLKMLLIRYAARNNFTYILGKQRVPLWMISEEKAVGFTYPWVRPPESVYGISDLSNLHGVRTVYNWNYADYTIRPSITVGEILDYPGETGFAGTKVNIKSGYFNVDVASDNLEYRGVYGEGRGEVDLSNPALLVPSAYGGLASIPDVATGRLHMLYTFKELGVRATLGNTFLMAEYAELYAQYLNTTGIVSNIVTGGDSSRMRGAYATIGYHVNDWIMPRLTYGSTQSRSKFSGKGLKDLSSTLSAAGVGSDITNIRNLSRGDALNFGVNFKVSDQAMYKVEIDRTRKANCANCETDGPVLGTLPRGAQVTSVRSVVDFVF